MKALAFIMIMGMNTFAATSIFAGSDTFSLPVGQILSTDQIEYAAQISLSFDEEQQQYIMTEDRTCSFTDFGLTKTCSRLLPSTKTVSLTVIKTLHLPQYTNPQTEEQLGEAEAKLIEITYEETISDQAGNLKEETRKTKTGYRLVEVTLAEGTKQYFLVTVGEYSAIRNRYPMTIITQ